MQIRRRRLQQEIPGLVEFHFRLARKSDDDVNADAGLGHAVHNVGESVAVKIGPVSAAHGAEHGVAAALEGDVEVRLEFHGVRHEIDQRGLEQVRFNRTDAVAFNRREASVFLKRPAEIEEGFPLSLAEVADVHPGQDDFPGPGRSSLPCLDEGGGNVRRAGTTPCEGNGAKGTEIIASVLHLEETARAVPAAHGGVKGIDIANLPALHHGRIVSGCLPGALGFQMSGQVEFFLGTKDEVHAVDVGDLLRLELGIAPNHRHK